MKTIIHCDHLGFGKLILLDFKTFYKTKKSRAYYTDINKSHTNLRIEFRDSIKKFFIES